MTTTTDAGLDISRAEFERACSLLPPEFVWGLPVTPRLVLDVAEAALLSASKPAVPEEIKITCEHDDRIELVEIIDAKRIDGTLHIAIRIEATAPAQPCNEDAAEQADEVVTDEQIKSLSNQFFSPTVGRNRLIQFARALLTATQPATGAK